MVFGERTEQEKERKKEINVIFLFHGDSFSLDLCAFGWVPNGDRKRVSEFQSVRDHYFCTNNTHEIH